MLKYLDSVDPEAAAIARERYGCPHRGSWERLCHNTAMPAFMLGMRKPESRELQRRLREERPERTIGVIYREQSGHYFQSRLGEQFGKFIWFEQTRAVIPLILSR